MNWFLSKVWDLDFGLFLYLWMSICTTTIWCRNSFSYWILPSSKSIWPYLCGLFWVPCSVLLIFFHDHTVCITMYSVLKSGRLTDIFLIFFLATTVSFNLLFLSWSHCVACGILVPWPESETYARYGVLTTGPPEMSRYYSLFAFPKILE